LGKISRKNSSPILKKMKQTTKKRDEKKEKEKERV
jgi:hypothetical protein